MLRSLRGALCVVRAARQYDYFADHTEFDFILDLGRLRYYGIPPFLTMRIDSFDSRQPDDDKKLHVRFTVTYGGDSYDYYAWYEIDQEPEEDQFGFINYLFRRCD